MMIIASRILAALLGILGLLISISNWRTGARHFHPKKFFTYRHVTPLLGGFLISMGMILSLSKPLYSLAWIGFIIDYGCVPDILHTLIANIYHHISTRRKKAAESIRERTEREK